MSYNPQFTLVVDSSKLVVYAKAVGALDPPDRQSPQSAATSPLTNDTPASSTSISVGVDGETMSLNTFHSTESFQTLGESSSTAPRPITTTSSLNLQTPEGKPPLTDGGSQTISSLAIENQPSLKLGTQTVTANSESRNVFDAGQTLSLGSGTSRAVSESLSSSGKATLTNGLHNSSAGAMSTRLPALIIGSQTVRPDDRDRYILVNGQPITPGSTTTLGSEISTTLPGLQTSFVTGPSTSLLSPATAAPALPGTPTVLTIGGHTMTASSLGQYNIKNQTLRPGHAMSAAVPAISLAPEESDSLVATHTDNLSTNFTASLASGPKATSVQIFKGNALGARDELCSSSMLTLIGIAILLWFR